MSTAFTRPDHRHQCGAEVAPLPAQRGVAPQLSSVCCRHTVLAAVFGLCLFTGIVLMSLFGPALYGVDSDAMVARPFSGPGEGSAPLLGSDYLGRDVLAGVISGGRTTLVVGAVAAAMSITIGLVIGSLAGFYGRWVDALFMRLTEIFQVLPALLFAMVIVALFEPSTRTIAIAIGLASWPGTARLTRAEFLRLKNLEFVKAARATAPRS